MDELQRSIDAKFAAKTENSVSGRKERDSWLSVQNAIYYPTKKKLDF